jgi:predicted nuclease with TOPRIM domain
MSGGDAELRRRVEDLEHRLRELEAHLEALDASYVRHQGQNEAELDRLQRIAERSGEELNHHLDAHWRSR